MIKIRYAVILLVACMFAPFLSQGQEAKAVAEKLETVFGNLRPADRKALTEGYLAVMASSFITVEEKARIDTVFQDLQDLRVTVTPELKDFIRIVNGFCRREEKDNLQVWLEGMENALSAPERKRTLVKNYLQSTAEVAAGNILYNGSGHQWLVRGKLYWKAGDPIRIDFREADLVCRTRKDSILISGTGGTLQLGAEELTARGGKVVWKDAEDMFAELTDYQVQLKFSNYTADSVFFHYEEKYKQPIRGTLKDNALKYQRPEHAPYPEFSSYHTDIRIDHVFRNISFQGGITYAGKKFSGTGTEEHPASLKIVPNDTVSLTLYSRQFLFDSLKVMSGAAAMAFRMDTGEISHSNINFLYLDSKHEVTIKRINEKSLHLPFKDSYHRILFDMEELQWPIDSNYMTMMMSSRSGLFKATIESMNYFSDQVYDGLQGMDEVNPLNGLLKCSLERQSNVFTLSEYAEYLRKPLDQLRKQVILLSYDDFVDYNEARDEVTLKPRLFEYTRARVGKQDYDNIRFSSLPGKSRVNAVLDIRNFNLKIYGVEKFVISEKRNISVEPSDGQVMMMKNRDMAFNGKLNAGMFDMYGNNLFFSYRDYKIKLAKVDSTSMYLAGRDKNIRGRKVRSLIHDITGEIVIDKPDNKSGKKEDPGFPLLQSEKESYVYFDAPSIQNGQYKRDSFYFVINPYTIRGINDAEKFRYAFGGTLVSNIVSPINDTLRLMPDNALGLTYTTPAAGILLYGKGHLYDRVYLDRNGFFARGKVNLNQSDFQSDSILMLPQRMTAQTREIKVYAVKDQRPEAQGKEVGIEYIPKTGNLQAISTSQPFEIYAGRIRHSGKLLVYENLLDASGKLEIEGASLSSRLFHLHAGRLESANSSLNMVSLLNKDIRLNTADVKADIDLLANKGKFVNNRDTNYMEFTASRYLCSFESFIWDMKEACLNIGPEDRQQLAGIWKIENESRIPKGARNIFLSGDRLKDSLRFVAPQARYDLKEGNIDCHWVNHIDVANGRFYPPKGEVLIKADGTMQEFTDGKLLCERTDTTKMLHQVRFNLSGRYRFTGSGDYTYVSEEKEKSILHFASIGVDTARLIYANAVVKDDEPLLLNAGFRYKGKVTLFSQKPDLWFAGSVRMTADTTYLKHTWLFLKDYLDSRHIRVSVKVENRNDKQQRIYNGLYLHTDQTYKPYAAFLSNRQFYNDRLMIGGAGKLEWSGALKQYIISDTVADTYYRFRFDPEEATVSSFGLVNLDMNLAGMTLRSAGDIHYDLKTEKLVIKDLLCLVDFSVLPKMEGILLKDFGDKKLKTISVTAALKDKIFEICGKENVSAVDKQLQRQTGNVPDSLNHLFVLDSLTITWNAKTRSYVGNGQVNITAIRGKAMDKPVRVKMELLPSRSGNQFFMYIYDDNMWYYFEYSEGSLYSLSSNEEYNNAIKLEKADKKVVYDKEKQRQYTITLSPDSKKERFLKRVK